MNFIELFHKLKDNYEKKEKSEVEATTYEFLKQLISHYGYDSVCDEIPVNNEKHKSKNKELSYFINETKKKLSVELLCSQLFYLDDSQFFSQNNEINSHKNIKSNSFQGKKKNESLKFNVRKSVKK